MFRTERGTDGRRRSIPVAQRGGELDQGVLTSAVIVYPADGDPDRVRIDVPYGVRWGAAVVVND